VSGQHLPISIPLHPWFQDHHFAGRAVLPAVETLLLLAREIHTLRPDLDLRVMEQARFAKFLVVPPDIPELAALLHWQTEADGAVTATLQSRVQTKAMSRLQEHGAVRFPGTPLPDPPDPGVDRQTLSGPIFALPAATIYQELVPFGPSYRSLCGTLRLSSREADGTLQAPALPVTGAVEKILGSPFPLDGAMHAACVLGQRLVDFVPFPVGFARRCVFRPTRPGVRYGTRVRLIHHAPEELLFDLDIFQADGLSCETVSGLRMRDVSGGRIKPPAWIMHAAPV